MIAGVSTRGGLAYYLDRDGRPEGLGVPPKMFPWRLLRRDPLGGVPVVLVHGFGYDPWARGDDNPHVVGPLGQASTFGLWRRDLVPARAAIGLGWYSVPVGWRGLWGAWRHRRWNRYRWAWDLAEQAGTVLAVLLRRLDGPVDILCHSLGSRVVIAALGADTALPVKNVVFMNGAEFAVPAAFRARASRQVRFVNLVVKADDVLAKLDTAFAPVSRQGPPIGLAGLGARPNNWIDVALDDPQVQRWGATRGWHLAGDNPKQWADHWYTYRQPGNHGLIRAALNGDPLDPPAP